MTHEQMIALIRDYILMALKSNPVKEKNKTIEPNIYYMNGNDGTDFDWDCNDRTCEFMVFYDSIDQLGYCQVYATKDGELVGYVFDTERYSGGVKLPPLNIGVNKAREIKRLCKHYDNTNCWDKKVGALYA